MINKMKKYLQSLLIKANSWTRAGTWNNFLRILTAFLPLLLAALLRFLDVDVVKCCLKIPTADGAACDRLSLYLIYAWAGGALILAWLLYRIISTDELKKKEQLEKVESREQDLKIQQEKINQAFRSISMIPNLAVVVEDYGKITRRIYETATPYSSRLLFINEIIKGSKDLDEEMAKASKSIRACLLAIIELTRNFNQATSGKNPIDFQFGANVMLPFEENDELSILEPRCLLQALLPRSAFPKGEKGETSFKQQDGRSEEGILRFAASGIDVTKLNALLVLRSELCVVVPPGSEPSQHLDLDAEIGPMLVLPVQITPPDQLLQGAPEALLRGGIKTQDSIEQLIKERNGKSPPYIVHEMIDYFSEGGPGAKIESFFSVRFGEEGKKPIAVLSVDSGRESIVGTHSDQSKAFLALLVPILAIMTPLVDYYGRIWRANAQATKASQAPKQP